MARASVVVLGLAACLLVAAVDAAPWATGVATFTGEDVAATSVPNGACGYGPLTAAQYPGLNFAGVSLKKSILGKYALKGCGACLEVRCTDKEACSDPSKTLVVQVVDDCDECAANQVNLQAPPFAKLASPHIGRISIEYREVPCAFPGNVVMRVDSYRASGGGWVRLLFKNINGAPLDKVELAKAGTGAFRPMKNGFGAAFEASRLPELPWDIRLTNTEGKTLLLTKAMTADKTGDVETAANF